MQAIRNLFGAGAAPANESEAAADDIYPLFLLDNMPMLRDVTLSHVMQFSQVLDADKLQDGLTSLLQYGDWRKLGGRLRMRVRIALVIFKRVG